MITRTYAYTYNPPVVTGGQRNYLGGESSEGGTGIYPATGGQIAVARQAEERRATVAVHTWNGLGTSTSLAMQLNASELRRLAHRLLDAAADLDAADAAAQEVATCAQ